MSQAPNHWFTFHDYLRVEADSAIKHEFLDGQVSAMAGGTANHAAMAANVIVALATRLRGRPCRVFTSDLRIRVTATGLGTYPDVSVVCGPVEVDPEDPYGHTAINPVVLVEVLSPTTEAYDRGKKLAHYQQIATLQEIVLVAHDEPRIDVWRRGDDGGWTVTTARGTEASVELGSIGCALPLAEIYADPLAG